MSSYTDFLFKLQNGVNVVGNATSLKDHEYGEEIDSLPTIRFNWIQLDQKYTGKRTDIVCTNFPRKLIHTYEWLIANRPHAGFKNFVYPKKLLDSLTKGIGKKPSNGCRLLYLLDWMAIENVTVYGFDWKETPTLIIKDKKSTSENEHHDYQREKQLCYTLIEDNKWTLK